MQISEYVIMIIQNAFSGGSFIEYLHQPVFPRGWKRITIAEFFNILFFKARKVLIKLGVEIFPVAVPQRQSHTETEYALNSTVNAHVKNRINVFFSIVDVWQYRT